MPEIQSESAYPAGARGAAGRLVRWVSRFVQRGAAEPAAAATTPAARMSTEVLSAAQLDRLDRLVAERTAELERARIEAEQTARAKARFLANISHELRTPMHAVLSYAQLGKDASQLEQREYFERITERGTALLRMLSDLLDLSRLEAGSMSMEFAPHDLESLARDALQVAQPRFSAKGVRSEYLRLPTCERCRVLVDAVLLGKVFDNLLDNAVRYSPEAGVVRVQLSAARLSEGDLPAVEVSIVDAGVGIPEAELGLIFDEFVQSSKTRTNAGGTGLGLAICREIIAIHGGKIWASNNHGQGPGATLHVVLPLAIGGSGRGTV
jgi:signal transduction histidine kinase